jgi:Skp family chaperone for outer membrane proteins
MSMQVRWLVLAAWMLAAGSALAQNGYRYPAYPQQQQYPAPMQTQSLAPASTQSTAWEEPLATLQAELNAFKATEQEELDAIKAKLDELSRQLQASQATQPAAPAVDKALEERLYTLESTQTLLVWGIGAAGLLALMGLVLRLPRRERGAGNPTEPARRPLLTAARRGAVREFTGLLRPDLPQEIPLEHQEQWVEQARKRGAWQAEWEATVKQGLQRVLDSGRPNADSQVAMFLLDFWCPLLACYETDTQQWIWFQQKFLAACPEQWQGEVYVPTIVGKFVSEVATETDRILGQGETVKEITRPAVALRTTQQTLIAQRKAWAGT